MSQYSLVRLSIWASLVLASQGAGIMEVHCHIQLRLFKIEVWIKTKLKFLLMMPLKFAAEQPR